MKLFFSKCKIIGQIIFVIIFLFTSNAYSLDKFDSADSVSDYFSGILLLNENQYDESYQFLKKLSGLENRHLNYSVKYLYSLVNSGNLREAFNYSRKLEKKKLDNFESLLITGVFYLKNSKFNLAQKYFLKAQKKNPRSLLNKYVSNSLYNWSSLSNLNFDKAKFETEKLDKNFENFKKIQNIFLNCYFNLPNTNTLFLKLISNQNTDFSRYKYFYALYLVSNKKIENAKKIINSSLKTHPRNLLLNQLKNDLDKNKKSYYLVVEKKPTWLQKFCILQRTRYHHNLSILYQIFI